MENRRRCLQQCQKSRKAISDKKLKSFQKQLQINLRSNVFKVPAKPSDHDIIHSRSYAFIQHRSPSQSPQNTSYLPRIKSVDSRPKLKPSKSRNKTIKSLFVQKETKKMNQMLDQLDLKLASLERQVQIKNRLQMKYPELSKGLNNFSTNQHPFQRSIYQKSPSHIFIMIPTPVNQYPLSPYSTPNYNMVSQNQQNCFPASNFNCRCNSYNNTHHKCQGNNNQFNKLNHSSMSIYSLTRSKITKKTLTNVKMKSKISSSPSVKKFRKFRKCVWVILFIRTLKKFISCIRAQKFILFKGESQKSIFKEAQNFIIAKFSKIQFYQIFDKIQKKHIKNLSESQNNQNKDKIVVRQNNTEFFIDLNVCNEFIIAILSQIQQIVQGGELYEANTFLIHFINGQFPYHQIFLEQQLKFINFQKKTGCLQIDKSLSEQLLINYIFIKIMIYSMVLKGKQVSDKIRKQYYQHENQKKRILLMGKKIKICIIFLYFVIKREFLRIGEQNKSNYSSLPDKLKVVPHSSLNFDFNFSQINKIQTHKLQLIHGITGSNRIQHIVIEKLNYHMIMIHQIAQNLYKHLINKKRSQLRQIKNRIIKNGLILRKVKYRMPSLQNNDEH